MNPLNGSREVVSNLPDGGEIRLPKLSPSDVVALANRISSKRKDELRRNLEDAAVPPGERLKVLNEFDARPVRRSDLIMAASDPGVQLEMLRLSLSRQFGREATIAEVDALPISALSSREQVHLFLGLMNYVEKEEPAHPPAGGAAPPDTTSPSPTTSPTPAASASPSA
jgi:hypothetical protein